MPSIPKILGLNSTTEREMDARKDLLMVPFHQPLFLSSPSMQ